MSAAAIDLPGAGNHRCEIADITLERYVEYILSMLSDLAQPALVVAHSMAGVSVTQAADLAPELFAGVAYLAAAVPQDGESMLSIVTRPGGHGSSASTILSDDGARIDYASEALVDSFYADCSIGDINYAKQHIGTQAMQPVAAPVTLRNPEASRIPRFYIETLHDRSLPIEHQRGFIAAAQPIEVHTLSTSHSPFFSAPAQLADTLLMIAKRIVATAA